MTTAAITKRLAGKSGGFDPRKFRPTGDRVLVRELPAPERADGLIIIRENPETVDAVSGTLDGSHGDYRRVGIHCEVLAVGPGRMSKRQRRIPMEVKVGDRITCTAWNDLEDWLPQGFRLIQEADIWFVHEKNQV